MINPILEQSLEPALERARKVRRWRIQARAIGATAAAGLIGCAISPMAGWLLLLIAGVVSGIWAMIRIFSVTISAHDIALRIEQAHPDMRALLLTAVEQQPQGGKGLDFHQQRVIDEAIEHARKHQWIAAISDRELRWARLLRGAALCLMSVAFVLLFVSTASHDAQMEKELAAAAKRKAEGDASSYRVQVTPGDVTIERGERLPVIARFDGALPPAVKVLVGPDTDHLTPMTMTRNLEDPVFGLTLPPVENDSVYRVRFGAQTSQDFRITTYEHPTLLKADATIAPPPNMHAQTQVVRDTRAVSVIEGSTLTFQMQMNKPVANAQWLERNSAGDVVKTTELKPVANDPTHYEVSWKPPSDQKLELKLTDADGRANKAPILFEVAMKENSPPQLEPKFPAKDVAVSPVQELHVEAGAWDDFGVTAWGVSYALNSAKPQEVELGRDEAGRPRLAAEHLISLEQLGAKPDDLVAYSFWAQDVGPDGKPRRVSSDMYLAEVRAFETILRDGGTATPDGSKPKPPGPPPTKLPELQKMIINATWRLERQEKLKGKTDPAHVATVASAQKAALDIAARMEPMINDPAAAAALREAMESMQKSSEELSRPALATALAAEQKAYQALLKLRVRELTVIVLPPGAEAPAMAQQIKELGEKLEMELKPRPYEGQRPPEAQAKEQQQDLDMLAKLRELARREADLKDKINELQAELALAKDQQQRDQIQRELKRLADQQQKLLREMDQARQEMAKRESSPQTSKAQQQLSKAREAAQQASAAMSEGKPAEAAAASAQAQEHLEEVREDLRKITAERMRQQLQRMADQADQLTKAQEKLEKDAQQAAQTGPGTPQKQLSDRAKEQHGQANQLADQMQKLSDQAEKAEPLAARSLYDALRSAKLSGMDDAFENSQKQLAASASKDAADTTKKAGDGVRQLAQGVREASKRVLGDSNEAMRTAQREVADLVEQVEREFAAEAKSVKPPGAQAAKPNAAESAKPQAAETAKPQAANDSARTEEAGPLTGRDFRPWMDRLQDVQLMLDDTQLRDMAAQVGDFGWDLRRNYKRNSVRPQWNVVEEKVTKPLHVLSDRLVEQIARQSGENELAPIDRDPAPPRYESLVQKYYQKLGSGD